MAPQKTPKSEVKNDAHDARRFGPQTPSEMEPIFDPKSGSENGLQNDPISRFKSDVERAENDGLGKWLNHFLNRPLSPAHEARLQEQAWAMTDGGRRDPMPVFLPAGEEGLGATAT